VADPAGSVLGFEKRVPKPEPDHGYAATYGEELPFETATTFPAEVKLTPVVSELKVNGELG
jgi:hypothetical protein